MLQHNERLQLQVVAGGPWQSPRSCHLPYTSPLNPRVAIVLSGIVMFSLTASNGPVYGGDSIISTGGACARCQRPVVLLFAKLNWHGGWGRLATGAISGRAAPLGGRGLSAVRADGAIPRGNLPCRIPLLFVARSYGDERPGGSLEIETRDLCLASDHHYPEGVDLTRNLQVTKSSWRGCGLPEAIFNMIE